MIQEEDDDVSALTGAQEIATEYQLNDEEKRGAQVASKIEERWGNDGDDYDSDETKEPEGMEVDGFKCPDDLLLNLLPMEFEEMVGLFKAYDANDSGTIDKHEARKILQSLGMDASLEKAEELLKIVDADGSGEIDFDEFCHWIVLIKEGDERFAAFNDMLDKIHNTPLGDLEHQAKLRNFQLKFVTVEIRPATATQPQTFVVELHMHGAWFGRNDETGAIDKEVATRRFQGLGTTNRDAKYAACKVATQKLRQMMPGTMYMEGVFPDEWVQWIDDNLLRGVDPLKIISILAMKGFHAYANLPLMQRICVWQSFDDFLGTAPDFDITANSLDARFRRWVESIVSKGIDGAIVIKVLEDKSCDLKAEQPHYYQKLRNNEFGTLMGNNGTTLKHFDFYTACDYGFHEDVLLYCKAAQPLLEEFYYRRTGQYEHALLLAAGSGHAQVVATLIEYGADVKTIDNRGRSALHRAAMGGHTATCRVLAEKGAKIFEGDFQGNTALHYAAGSNFLELVDYLSWQGQEYSRIVCSDKVRCKVGVTFNELAAKVFVVLIEEKLKDSDVRRFEKAWLHDACVTFKLLMDHDVRRFLPYTCAPIMIDVLARFDPRPETGVFVSSAVGETQDFIPTVPSPVELATLMRSMFKQAAIDSVNSMRRTSLHIACDANQINSHEDTIKRLIDIYGCNTQLRDIHNRRPIDLLMIDRQFPGKPSATLQREEFIFVDRDRKLQELSDNFAAEEMRKNNARRAEILNECAERATMMIPTMWEAVRNASIFRRKFAGWEMYEDPESLNSFYCIMPLVQLDGERYKDFTWSVPPVVKPVVDRTWAYLYQFYVRSERLHKFGNWQQFRCKLLGLDVYFDEKLDKLRYTMPKEAAWSHALKDSVVVQKLGFTKEYDELRDKSGNLFYRHSITKDMVWDRPVDAVIATPADMFCTAFQYKKKEMAQKLFTCEQCNRAWKASPEGARVTLRVCESCIERCHQGHKGIRQLDHKQPVVCLCDNVCRIIPGGKSCCATVISGRQSLLQSQALDNRIETMRKREHNALMPPIFANVPPRHPDGSSKRLSGWLLCRRPPLKGAETMGELQEQEDDETTATGKSTVSFSTQSGSLNKYEPVAESVQEQLLHADDYPYVPPEGLPEGWIEVMDVEEPAELHRGMRVLVDMTDKGPGVPFVYGNIVTKINRKKNVYLVRADINGGTTMKVARSRIETVGRATFFFDPVSGASAWTIEEAAAGEGFPSIPMQLPGREWWDVYELSTLRRAFEYKGVEEMQHVSTKMIFYVDAEQIAKEKAACVLQKFARNRLRLQWPPHSMPFQWGSSAFSTVCPAEIEDEKKSRAAWAYLRRRAKNLGEFFDDEGDEWDEYVDNDSSEYFYWQEDDNRYQWAKPPVPQKSKVVVEYLKMGEEVYFRFPGKRYDDIVVITRLRFDDETGGDMYDIEHKYDSTKKVTWVARMRLKQVPQGGDIIAQKREERAWRTALKRQREAEERRKKRDSEKKLADELQRLEDIRSGKLMDAGPIGDAAKMIQGRTMRAEMERKVHRDEIDQREGVARREKMREIVNQIKETSPTRLSRADVLSLERVTEVKLIMEERIRKRNELAFELIARRKAVEQRAIDSEAYLQGPEAKMTTPRSIIRRRVCRRVHLAMRRQDDCFMVCEWGCQDWVKVGFDQMDHQLKRCSKRILGCTLLCPLKMSEQDWLKPQFELTEEEKDALALKEMQKADAGLSITSNDSALTKDKISRQQYHETEECVKRLVNCPRQCLEWVVFEKLEHHMNELCTKRPANPIFCRLGCGAQYGGLVEKLIESEDERMMHETEECEFRMVRCNWQYPDGSGCAAQMMAKDRTEHRDYHLRLVGVTTFLVSGTHLFKVPKRCTRLKVQLWGGGGGSGYFYERQGGNGGGAAFVEAILNVEPYDVLEIVIGTGGCAGASGGEIESADIELQRAEMKVRKQREMFLSKQERLDPNRRAESMAQFAPKEANCGMTMGGVPGGGEGYGGGGCWASGGGGGYSIVAKRTPRGNQALLVAAGGGGGGSLHGCPGGTMSGDFPGALIDPICGGTATSERGGMQGDCGSVFNAQWPAEPGKMWGGGNGSEFGAGGGGGYFGGGGGGTRPGLAGGGGGGASYVYLPQVLEHVLVAGHARMPGGLTHDPPDAVGCGEWDKVGGLVGEGGLGDKIKTHAGNSGACRILRPGYY